MDYEIRTKIIDGHKTYWKIGDCCQLLNDHDNTASELFDYNSDCSLCYLGYGHSGNLHRRLLHSFYAK